MKISAIAGESKSSPLSSSSSQEKFSDNEQAAGTPHKQIGDEFVSVIICDSNQWKRPNFLLSAIR